jgi:hypothetical protein
MALTTASSGWKRISPLRPSLELRDIGDGDQGPPAVSHEDVVLARSAAITCGSQINAACWG